MPSNWYIRLKELVWASIASWLFFVLALVEASQADANTPLVIAYGFASVSNAILALRD